MQRTVELDIPKSFVADAATSCPDWTIVVITVSWAEVNLGRLPPTRPPGPICFVAGAGAVGDEASFSFDHFAVMGMRS